MKQIINLALALFLMTMPVFSDEAKSVKPADELLGRIQRLDESLRGQSRAPLPEQMDTLRAAMLEFETRFPDDPRKWEVRFARLQIETLQAQLDGRIPDRPALLRLTGQLIEAPDAPMPTKIETVVFQAGLHVDTLNESGPSIDKKARAALDADIAWLQTNDAADTRIFNIQFRLVRSLIFRDPDTVEEVLHKLERSNNMYVADTAAAELASMPMARTLAKEPLRLKFQAVDGSDVDLDRLRGKVVLLEFWASSASQCRAGLPPILNAYKQLHKDGFEIVGISFDQNKEQLLSCLKLNGITWPQYFDGKGLGNEIGSRFRISALPSAWLLDKKGLVRTTEVPDLANQVRALLAE